MGDSKSSNPNPPYGDKGQFRKLTVTVPPDVYERLIQESARRKIAGESNQLLSALLREALSDYLDRIDSGGARGTAGTPHAA
jgi:transcriptional regulator of met regulon